MTNKKIFYSLLVFIILVAVAKFGTNLLREKFSINIEDTILVCFFTVSLVVYVLFKYKSK